MKWQLGFGLNWKDFMLSTCNMVRRYSLVNVIFVRKYRNAVYLNDFFFNGKLFVRRGIFQRSKRHGLKKSFQGQAANPYFARFVLNSSPSLLNPCAVIDPFPYFSNEFGEQPCLMGLLNFIQCSILQWEGLCGGQSYCFLDMEILKIQIMHFYQ